MAICRSETSIGNLIRFEVRQQTLHVVIRLEFLCILVPSTEEALNL